MRLFRPSAISLALAAFLTFGTAAAAKDIPAKGKKSGSLFSMPRNELSLTYGFYTLPYSMGSVSDLFNTYLPSSFRFKDMKSSGAISLEYYYNFGRHFALGMNASFEGLRVSVSQDGGKTFSPDISCSHFNFGPSLKLRWFDMKIFSMYTKLGLELGCTNAVERDVVFEFVPQIIPVGAEIGGKHVRAFVELLGIGGTGFLAGGLSVRF